MFPIDQQILFQFWRKGFDVPPDNAFVLRHLKIRPSKKYFERFDLSKEAAASNLYFTGSIYSKIPREMLSKTLPARDWAQYLNTPNKSMVRNQDLVAKWIGERPIEGFETVRNTGYDIGVLVIKYFIWDLEDLEYLKHGSFELSKSLTKVLAEYALSCTFLTRNIFPADLSVRVKRKSPRSN